MNCSHTMLLCTLLLSCMYHHALSVMERPTSPYNSEHKNVPLQKQLLEHSFLMAAIQQQTAHWGLCSYLLSCMYCHIFSLLQNLTSNLKISRSCSQYKCSKSKIPVLACTFPLQPINHTKLSAIMYFSSQQSPHVQSHGVRS